MTTWPLANSRLVLIDIGSETAGAVSVEMCRDAGIPSSQVRWRVRSGRWQRLFPRVYAAFSGPVGVQTRQFAALLYAGGGAALSHRPAGALWRLCAEPDEVHVIVRHARQVDACPGLVVRRSRTITEAQVHPALRPRRTRVERTVIDLLADQPTADRALGSRRGRPSGGRHDRTTVARNRRRYPRSLAAAGVRRAS